MLRALRTDPRKEVRSVGVGREGSHSGITAKASASPMRALELGQHFSTQ